MHSHHSHSGDYIAHGVDPLEDVTSQAIKMGFHVYCLTEHTPRINAKFLYPEERDESCSSEDAAMERLQDNFSKFLTHAKAIKNRPNASGVKFLIGAEVESCDLDHIEFAKQLIEEKGDTIQFCVGSVHHVNEIPIDFDKEEWMRALAASHYNLKDFILSYFDLQYKMLTALKPLVVGHFDLYKLFLPNDLKIDPETGDCKDDGVPVSTVSLINQWDSVKKAVIRNLKFIKSYDGLIEINTSALRKKLPEPYPGADIGKLVIEYCGGRFVLSDDAHGVAQVGVCYDKALKYITDVLKLERIYFLSQNDTDKSIKVDNMSIEEFRNSEFWARNFKAIF